MANVTKRNEVLSEETAQQSKQGADSSSLQNLLALFDAEMKRQLKAFRATSGERMNLSRSGGNANDNRSRPQAPTARHHPPGRDIMRQIGEGVARDIRDGEAVARAIQDVYGVARTPISR